LSSTDHLANERTFLAYVRTSLSFIAFGFVIARFSLFAQEFSAVTHQKVPSVRISTPFGVAMAAIGLLVALYGARRYASAYAAISAGKTSPMPPSVAIGLGVLLALIGLVVAVALLAFK
jgi:putative membrane protein